MVARGVENLANEISDTLTNFTISTSLDDEPATIDANSGNGER